jgi:uncharacterized protein
MKNTSNIISIAVIIILAAIAAYYFVPIRSNSTPVQNTMPQTNESTTTDFQTSTKNATQQTNPTITIGSTTLKLEIADTSAERVQGLSGRSSLPQDTGLLFVFDKPEMWGFWMKDMNFSIDIIWLDESYTVVGLKENATPESYPQTFKSEKPALYVLETNTGFIKTHRIKLGTQVVYNNSITN